MRYFSVMRKPIVLLGLPLILLGCSSEQPVRDLESVLTQIEYELETNFSDDAWTIIERTLQSPDVQISVQTWQRLVRTHPDVATRVTRAAYINREGRLNQRSRETPSDSD